MTWLKESVMQQKERFIRMWLSVEFTVTALCKSLIISRRSGYNLINAYHNLGEKCFMPGFKAPHNIPHKTPLDVELKIVQLRKQYKL